jgi:phosphomannomutase
MIDAALVAEVENWIELDPDPTTAATLRTWLAGKNETELRKSFNGFLQFGTAGLRGPVGPGPSCMNRAVVGRTAAGLAAYMKQRGLKTVIIGRDARHGSEEFSQESAEILSGAGLTVFILPRPLPTPVLAYAVNKLNIDCGIMVTASHNPREDNGYKVYLGGTVDGVHYRGSQIIAPADTEIAQEIAAITNTQPRGTSWTVLDDTVVNDYANSVAALVTKPEDIKVVYSAMHGVGTQMIQWTFHKAGFTQPILVDAQAQPDPDFPTVKFPNPEEPGAIDLSLEAARAHGADLVIANDPDADRCAVATLDPVLGWRMLRGDEVGALLGYYIATRLPDRCQGKTFGNSIVSSSLLAKISAHYGIAFQEVLTGFKWLAKIENLSYGYEEALGYAVDPASVNDKDGISAALLLAKIAGELKSENVTIIEYLDQIWKTFGFHRTEQISIRVNDLAHVDAVLSQLRGNHPTAIAGYAVTKYEDLLIPKDGLPPTNALRLFLDDGIRIIIRPSGTEAKLKCYIEVVRPSGSQSDKSTAEETINSLRTELLAILT